MRHRRKHTDEPGAELHSVSDEEEDSTDQDGEGGIHSLLVFVSMVTITSSRDHVREALISVRTKIML